MELPAAEMPTFNPPKGNTPGGFYDFTLRASLTTITCVKLAKVIVACRNGGTRKLRLLLPDGTVLGGWSDEELIVNDQMFYWMAQQQGL